MHPLHPQLPNTKTDPSIFPQDGSTVDRVDKAVSSPLFWLSFGPLEIPLSVPGAVFGTAPFLFLGPTVLTAISDWPSSATGLEKIGFVLLDLYKALTTVVKGGNVGGASNAIESLVTIATGSSSTLFSLGKNYPRLTVPILGFIVYLVLWISFLIWFRGRENEGRLGKFTVGFLWGSKGYVLFFLLGLLGSRVDESWGFSGDGGHWRAGALLLTCWSASLFPIICLKKWTKRRRPCVCFFEDTKKDEPVPRKFLSAMTCTMLHDGSAAFPSGDVSGAVSFAISLHFTYLRAIGAASNDSSSSSSSSDPGDLVHSDYLSYYIALTCVGLSAFGRMYFLAHHLFDVIIGATIAVVFTIGPIGRGGVVPLLVKASVDIQAELSRGGEGLSKIEVKGTSIPTALDSIQWWHPVLVHTSLLLWYIQAFRAAEEMGKKKKE